MTGVALTAYLMGGLGNQMFQYAAARALASRSDAALYLDTVTGFARDKVFRRTYELGSFPIKATPAGALRRAFLPADAVIRKVRRAVKPPISARPWGEYLYEPTPAFSPAVAKHRIVRKTWMQGYWQDERYFADLRDCVRRELTPRMPLDPGFRRAGDQMESQSSVAVGVRLFEEVPGASKAGVGGLTPIEFFNRAAIQLAERVRDPVFYVFCTSKAPELESLSLPGPVHFITHDNGFSGSIRRLWLLTNCQHHILSNSSFYWWGAWLREAANPGCQVIASPLFPSPETTPSRWLSTAR